MRVYIAGASSEIERAEKWMAELRAAGIEVVSTWPEVIRKVGSANPMGAPREQRAQWSATDLGEVSSADVFWFLLPHGKPTAGAYTEFGYAVMLGALATQARQLGVPDAPSFWIVVSGTETSIFTALADHFPTDEECFETLKRRSALSRFLKPQATANNENDAHNDGG